MHFEGWSVGSPFQLEKWERNETIYITMQIMPQIIDKADFNRCSLLKDNFIVYLCTKLLILLTSKLSLWVSYISIFRQESLSDILISCIYYILSQWTILWDGNGSCFILSLSADKHFGETFSVTQEKKVRGLQYLLSPFSCPSYIFIYVWS